MSSLLGAWSLGPLPPQDLLGEAAVRAMLGHVGANIAELARGRLWMVADRSKVTEDARGCAAYEGFIPDGSFAANLPDDWRRAPEGHFVLAQSNSVSLRLLRALSGGERLYYTRVGAVVLFSSTLRALLALPGLATCAASASAATWRITRTWAACSAGCPPACSPRTGSSARQRSSPRRWSGSIPRSRYRASA
jgi:hypothetical protein